MRQGQPANEKIANCLEWDDTNHHHYLSGCKTNKEETALLNWADISRPTMSFKPDSRSESPWKQHVHLGIGLSRLLRTVVCRVVVILTIITVDDEVGSSELTAAIMSVTDLHCQMVLSLFSNSSKNDACLNCLQTNNCVSSSDLVVCIFSRSRWSNRSLIRFFLCGSSMIFNSSG